ncbi:MAG: FAD-dependent oxidoreductase [Polyangiaceae bacterium]
MRSLRKLFSEYRAARAHDLSVPSLREVRAEAKEARARSGGLRRRDLLAGAGAGALALGLPRAARAKTQPEIAIVGGGIAGLACALALTDKNVSPTVYEASGRIGGRMFTNYDYFDGQVAEWGGELVDSGHKSLIQLCKRFNLPLDGVVAAEPSGSEDTYKFFGTYYPRAQAEIDFEPVYDAVIDDVGDAPFPTLYNDFTAAGEILDEMSVYDWIETRVPGGHSSPMGQLLDAAYVIEYGGDSEEQSALNLIYLLAYQPTPNTFLMFGESDEAYHIAGGNQQLPQAIANHLGVGSTVKLGHSLVKIKKTPAGRYELTFQCGGSTFVKTVDYAVLCLPFAVLRELDYAQAGFDLLKIQAIQELGRSDNAKTQLQFATRFWNQPGAWPGISNGACYSDTGLQSSWEVSRAQPGTMGVLNGYTGGAVTRALTATTPFGTVQNNKVAQDVATTLARMQDVFPGAAAQYTGKAIQSIPKKSPFYKLSYSFYKPGQYTSFCGYEGARQDGVLFAGEHTSVDFQGYMNGGSETGQRAAKELLFLI